MNSRARLASLLLLALVLAGHTQTASAPAPSATVGPVGRFTIISATSEILHADTLGTTRVPVIIKLDTSTGRTWLLVSVVKDSRQIDTWQEITRTQ